MLIFVGILFVLFIWFVFSIAASAAVEAEEARQHSMKLRKEYYEDRFKRALAFIKPGADPILDRLLLEAAEKFDADPFQYHIFKEYDAHRDKNSEYDHGRAARCVAAGIAPF